MKLVTEKGRSGPVAARSLGIAPERLRRWKIALPAEGPEAFRGHGTLPPAGDDLRRLEAAVARLKAERETLTKAPALSAKESL